MSMCRNQPTVVNVEQLPQYLVEFHQISCVGSNSNPKHNLACEVFIQPKICSLKMTTSSSSCLLKIDLASASPH